MLGSVDHRPESDGERPLEKTANVSQEAQAWSATTVVPVRVLGDCC